MENMENLKILQDLAKDFSILFVEDSKALQKQVTIFLEKFFKKVYKASDGVEGITQYEEYKPDLILTDLTMPILNGHDMIREIKKINPDIDVIILSAHSDPETLMTSFHIGVSDFIQKPITAPKMINVFLKVLSNIKRKRELSSPIIANHIGIKEKDDKDILNIIFQSNMNFDLINYYKGVPIINSGKIIKIDEDELLIKSSYSQLLAIKNEEQTIIDCPEISENILCKVLYFDMDNYNVRLKKEKLFFPSSKHRNLSKVEPDEFLRTLIIKDELKIPIKIVSISIHEITFKVENITFDFSINKSFEILVYLKNEKLLANITISNIQEKNGYLLISSFIKHNDQNEEILKKYISNREKELLEEFKTLFLYD